MAMISRRVVVAATSTSANVVAGSIFEFLSKNATLKAGWVAGINTAPPAAAGDLTATWKIGDAISVEDAPVQLEAAAGAGVKANEDLKYIEAGRAGSRVTLAVTNSSANALEFEYYILIV